MAQVAGLRRQQRSERFDNVSHVMDVLERVGRDPCGRRRVDGLRGPAQAVSFVNAPVAWKSLDVCTAGAAQVRPVQPSLMEGGYFG